MTSPARRRASRPGRPRVIGILGGIASGKSTVARLLAERGARVVDADRIAREVLVSPGVRDALKETFGDAILGADGRVMPERLAEAAFGRPEQTARLNAIVHPPIIEEMRRRLSELADGTELVVVDAALLLETGIEREMCDALLFVDAPEEARQRRATALRGLSADQFRRREAAQMPAQTKKERADFIVRNAGPIEELNQQLEELWPELAAAPREN